MKLLRLLLASIIVFFFMGVSNTAMAQITVGTGTASTTANPIYSCYGYSYTEQIYLQSEIGSSGNITSVSFYINTLPSNGGTSSLDWTVYLGHTTQADYSSTTNWVGASNMTQVYTGVVTYPAGGNWMTITLTTPFAYNNTDNLVVGAYENTPGYDCSIGFAHTPTAVSQSINYRSDTNNPDPLAPPTASAITLNRPNIQFGGISQACPAPTALLASNITTTSATLGWTAGGTETTWDVEYGTAGFTQGSGTTVSATADTSALSTLSANNTYDYYVRAVCGVGDSSLWAGPFTFSTPCVAFTAPFTENFDGLALTSPYTDLPNCWDPQVGPDFWDVTNDVTNTGHSYLPNIGDHTSGSGNYMWIDASGSAPGIAANEMVTPMIDMSGLTTPFVGFWFASDNTNGAINHSINLDAWDGTAWVNLSTLSGNFAGWVEVSTTVPTSIPSTTKFRIYASPDLINTGSAFHNDLGIDDFFVMEMPSCVAPSALIASNITTTGATLGWTAGGTETAWDVEYGAAGFTQGSGITVSATANTYALATLSANNAYDYYVRAVCSAGDSSLWAGPFTFTTLCVASTVPYFEGFESGYTDNTAVAGCLSQESVAGTIDWTANSTQTSFNRAPYAGAWNAFLRYGNDDWLFIPIDLTGGTSYTFGAFVRQDGATATNSDVTVSYGTANNAAAMTNAIVPTTGIVDGAYQQLTGVFTPATTGTYYIGIKGYMNNSPYYISLDDISVITTPNCPAPNALTAANLTATSADLGWTENGAATSWEVEYGVTGFTQGTGTAGVVAANPYAVTGLTFETDYQFYVRAICAPGDTSPWSAAGSFFTGYCTPAPSSVDGIGITNVTMDTLNNTTGAETGNYGNYSTMVANTTPGGTLPIDITLETSYTYDMWAWVDWNNDLDFTDAGEEFFLGTSASANPTIFSTSIAIPATAALGNYRIRIGGADTGLGTTSPSSPCYTGSYAAFEDYTLNVVLPCTVTSSSVITNANCFGDASGSIAITATGGTAPYSYIWNDGQTTATATGLVAAAYNVTITDANGCSFVSGGSIGQPLAVATSSVITNASCFGDANGSIAITATGGIAPYTYVWNDGQTTATATGLVAAAYNVTITDANGCSFVSGGSTGQPLAVATSSVITNANCFGDANGSIAITATGGTTPYSYIWNDGQTTATATGLVAAAYNVTVTDANGCSFVSGGSIGQPLAVALTTASVSDTSGASVGTASVMATGGIAPYTYSWSDGQTTDIATGLAMGTYTVTVTDANGCTETETAIVDDFVGTTRIDYITNLSIYPNPTNGNTVIDLELSQNADIAVSIYTITGILVQDFGKENTSKATHTIDVSNYSAGMYLVRFVVDNQVVTKKLLVTK